MKKRATIVFIWIGMISRFSLVIPVVIGLLGLSKNIIFTWPVMLTIPFLVVIPIVVGKIALRKIQEYNIPKELTIIAILTLLFCNVSAGCLMLNLDSNFDNKTIKLRSKANILEIIFVSASLFFNLVWATVLYLFDNVAVFPNFIVMLSIVTVLVFVIINNEKTKKLKITFNIISFVLVITLYLLLIFIFKIRLQNIFLIILIFALPKTIILQVAGLVVALTMSRIKESGFIEVENTKTSAKIIEGKIARLDFLLQETKVISQEEYNDLRKMIISDQIK